MAALLASGCADGAAIVTPDAPEAGSPDAPSPDAGALRYPVDGRFREEDWKQVRRLTRRDACCPRATPTGSLTTRALRR